MYASYHWSAIVPPSSGLALANVILHTHIRQLPKVMYIPSPVGNPRELLMLLRFPLGC